MVGELVLCATTAAAPTKLEVVNQLRLHDEYLLEMAAMREAGELCREAA